jgi:hypothetical protein
LDVVVAQSAAVLELLSCEDKALLVRGNTLLVLDLALHVVDRVRWFHIKSDGLSGERLDKDLFGDNEKSSGESQEELKKFVITSHSFHSFNINGTKLST